ncbi:hypothetical protein HOY80DRAFT_1057698 [Tuber brumale]|nr:hypothetical protein HOY80DRAFT_1057698 [Tuber brumale]
MVETEVLAREAAAMRAYLLCRNFSVTDGAHPGTNALGAGNGTSPPPQQAASSSLAGGLMPPHRGYPGPGVGNTYVTRSLPGQGNFPMDNGSSGRMVTSQGVIVVGHPQVGT